MPSSTAQDLVSFFRSAARLTFRRSKTSAAAKEKPSSSSADDAAFKKYLSSIKSSSSSDAALTEKAKHFLKTYKAPPSSIISNSTISNSPTSSLHSLVNGSLTSGCRIGDDESAKQLSSDASSILYDEMDLEWDDENQERQKVEDVLDSPWFSRLSNNDISLQRKEASRVRKQKWVFKNTQTNRFGRLVKMSAMKLGSDAALELFGKLGRETGLKEYNALIKVCIEKARDATDEDVSLQQIYNAHEILKSMMESGVEIKEETYGQFLMYLIDSGMVEEFFFFHELIRDEDPDSLPRLAYYEMLLWIRVNNEVKIQELCLSAVTDDAEEKPYLRESLLLALCESDHKEKFFMLLETLNVTKVTSVSFLEHIFRALGKLLLEPYAERYLLALKGTDIGAENISNFILEYLISIPNLVVEDIIKKFQMLHTKFEVLPTSAQYEKLIRYGCELSKVHEALSVVDEAFESRVALSLETFHLILDACDRNCEFNLVHQINLRISQQNLTPNNETFRMMVLLHVKMKDFEGAYGVINNMQKMNLTPTASMYNTILGGYFREKNIRTAQNVLKQMKDANVKPDARTFSYLIANSQCEKDLKKFCAELTNSGIAPTKHVFMALINAYASFGKFENAKQVILNERIPVKNLIEIKSALIGALASNGQLPDALKMYEEVKGAGCNLDPKAIKCLIEHFQSEGELNKSLELLEKLNDSPYWTDACFSLISNCVRNESLRSTVGLLKQLKDKFSNAEVSLEVLFDEVFCSFAEQEPRNMQFGLNLLQAIKEELGVRPSRKILDFLLSACVNTKDSKISFLIWKEYETACLPYNVLSFVRMYQALLASGDEKSAGKLLSKIPKDDPHVRQVIKACQDAFMISQSAKTKGKKKKRALKETITLLDDLEAKTK